MADCSFYAQKWLMSDFGCDTVFLPKNLSSLSAHTLTRPQHHDRRCFLSLYFVGFPGVKTKKPVGLTGVDTKMVEDISNRKTPNAKTAILKNAIKNSGILHFF